MILLPPDVTPFVTGPFDSVRIKRSICIGANAQESPEPPIGLTGFGRDTPCIALCA